jgi:ABC-type cobalamin/Fe3+-siderophores transport system ATPase subunit
LSEEAPKTEYLQFDSEPDFQQALDRLLAAQGRELRIFDPDLSALRLNTVQRVEQLRQFLAASRTRRLYIAVHDPDYLTKYCPRMMALLSRFAHAIQVNCTHEEIRNIQDSFLVLDQSHYLRRPVAQLYRGALGLHDDTEALVMRARFTEIWSASFPGVAGTTLGL